MNFEVELGSLVNLARSGNFSGLTLLDSQDNYDIYSKDIYRYPFVVKMTKKKYPLEERKALQALSNSGITPKLYYANERCAILERIHGVELEHAKFKSEESLRFFLMIFSKIEDAGISIKSVSKDKILYDFIADRLIITDLSFVTFGNCNLYYMNRKRIDEHLFNTLTESYKGENFFNVLKECGYRSS